MRIRPHGKGRRSGRNESGERGGWGPLDRAQDPVETGEGRQQLCLFPGKPNQIRWI